MAALKTTFDHYIKNPAIVGTSTIQATLLKDNYAIRFDTLLVREGGNLQYKLYKDSKGNKYIHAKIPSESIPNFYYDVVIEFVESAILSVTTSLEKNNIKFFSNDPAFIFNYAYAFNKNGLIIDSLKNKLPKECLENKAIVRNPKSNIGAVKSFYFLYFFMKLKKLFSKSNWKVVSDLNDGTFNKIIVHASRKIDDRIRLGKKIPKNKPTNKRITDNRSEVYTSKNIKFVKKAETVKKVSSSKKSSFVKITKPISRTRKSKR